MLLSSGCVSMRVRMVGKWGPMRPAIDLRTTLRAEQQREQSILPTRQRELARATDHVNAPFSHPTTFLQPGGEEKNKNKHICGLRGWRNDFARRIQNTSSAVTSLTFLRFLSSGILLTFILLPPKPATRVSILLRWMRERGGAQVVSHSSLVPPLTGGRSQQGSRGFSSTA